MVVIFFELYKYRKSFTVYHEVTFGLKNDGDDIPTIENIVTVYTNSVIYGSIIIHNGVQ